MKKLLLIAICAVLAVPVFAQNDQKAKGFRFNGKVVEITPETLTIIHPERGEMKMPMRNGDRNSSIRPMGVKDIPDETWARIFGENNDDNTQVNASRIEMSKEKSSWAKAKFDKFGAVGYLIVDGEDLFIEVDNKRAKVVTSDKTKITYQERVAVEDIKPEMELKIDGRENDTEAWVHNLFVIVPEGRTMETYFDETPKTLSPATKPANSKAKPKATEKPEQKEAPDVEIKINPINTGVNN